MIPCPSALQPVHTNIVNRPEWSGKSPLFLRTSDSLCITLQAVSFRDRYGSIWTCPRGFPTDGMSYPFFLDWFKDRYDIRTRRSSTLHDFRYSMHDYISNWHAFDNRTNADLGLLDGLRKDEPAWARTDYIAVKLFGNPIYEHQEHDKMMMEWIDMAAIGDDLLNPYCDAMIQRFGTSAIF